MSSILDALKKLEADKAEGRQPTEGGFAEDIAERELVGRNPLRERMTIRLTPITLILGLLAGLSVFAGISAVVTLVVISRTAATQTSGPGRPVATPASTAAPQPRVADLADAAPAPVAESSGRAQGFRAASPPAGENPAWQESRPVPAPETETPVAPPVRLPTSVAARGPGEMQGAIHEVIEPEPVPPPAEKPAWQEPMIDASPAVAPIKKPVPPTKETSVSDVSLGDMAELAKQPLRESDKIRLGLAGMQINMLQPVTKHRPYASAIINLNQVYAGETIPRTDAKLIAIDGVKGVVIEMQHTKERFYVRF
jgi:hypothetical protein